MQKRKRKFEPGIFDLKPKRSRTGLGLFTLSPINKGACIIEYFGKEVAEAEHEKSKSNYLFEIRKGRVIDGNIRSNTARYINHSCSPNCEIEIYRSRIYVMAKRKIMAGEELNYDYGTQYFEEIIKPKGCKCLKCVPEEKLAKAVLK